MGFYDAARRFLETALREERFALSDALLARVLPLLRSKEPLRRGEFREAFIRHLQELRELRFHSTKLPS
jgi:hypothetical protein